MREIIKKILYILPRRTKIRTVELFIVILAGAFAELVGVSVILPLIDLGINPQNMPYNTYCRILMSITGWDEPKQIILALIILIAVIYVCKDVYLAWMNNVIYRFTMNLQRNTAVRLMRAYLKQPYSFFLKINTADIIRSVNDDTSGFQSTVLNLLQIASNGILCLMLMIYLFLTNPMITVIVCALVGSGFLTVYFFVNRRMRSMGKKAQQLKGRVIKTLQEAFRGIKEIKILGREDYFSEEYDRTYYQSANYDRKSNLYSLLPKYLIETIAILGILLCLAIAVLKDGGYSGMIGQLSVFAVAAFKLLPAVNAIYAYASTVQYRKASVDLVYRDIKEIEEKDALADRGSDGDRILDFKEALRAEDITFRYEGADKAVLKNAAAVIKKGESVGIVGKSGQGKTTFADILLGLLIPEEGKITSDGADISEYYGQWLSKIGYIPQNIFLSDATIRENIAFGVKRKDIIEENVKEAVKEAQLEEFIKTLPEGLDTSIGEAGVRLSGGQRQRIGIARALYNKPEILFFDEATSALDNDTEREVMRSIESLHGEKTMIIIAHRLTTLKHCDRILEVRDGKIIERDKNEVLEDGGEE